jgi:hypothetical protein
MHLQSLLATPMMQAHHIGKSLIQFGAKMPSLNRRIVRWRCLLAGFSSFFVSALLAFESTAPSQIAENKTAKSNRGYWESVERKFATTHFGNVAAIAAHNCYVESGKDSVENLDLTLRKIRKAEIAGADLIELDIKHEGGEIYVSHDDNGNTKGALFLKVLEDQALSNSDRPLFIEIKEDQPNSRIIEMILEQIIESGLAEKKTPIVFRAFDSRRRNLTLLKSALKKKQFKFLADRIMLHEFIQHNNRQSDRNFHNRIRRASKSGFHGVEFRFDAPGVWGGINYAKSLGLGVGLFTIPEPFGEVFVASFREDVDVLVVDYPIDKSRSVVEDRNGLIHLNANDIKTDASEFTYRSNQSESKVVLNLPTSPILQVYPAGHPFCGQAFGLLENRFATLHDADNSTGEGHLVSACVGLEDTNIPDGSTQSIIAKTDAGGFGLELHNPPGVSSTVLRFGVRVENSYVYATAPTNLLSNQRNHHIIAAYDGDGGVRMWIDGSNRSVKVSNATGEVVQNDSPVVVGADPQGSKDRRFFFRGLIQNIHVQSWGNH